MGASNPESGGRRRRAQSEINVTPLVDVMLVLLIIFMVTAPMMQQGIDVELPETKASGISMKEDPFVLVIRKDKTLWAGTANLPMTGFREKLIAIFSGRKDKQIYIQADKDVSYGFVAEAMAEIRAAGIHGIGLVTLPKSSP